MKELFKRTMCFVGLHEWSKSEVMESKVVSYYLDDKYVQSGLSITSLRTCSFCSKISLSVCKTNVPWWQKF